MDLGFLITVGADVANAVGGLGRVNLAMRTMSTSANTVSANMRANGQSVQSVGNSLYTFGRRLNSAVSEPLKKFGEESLKVGQDMVAFDNRWKVSMKSMAKEGTEWAEKMGKAVNMTGHQVQEEMLPFISLGKAIKMPAEEALKFSEKMTKLGNDVAAFKNIDTSVANDALLGMLKGRYRGMANLGVIINSTTMKEEAHREGIKKDIKDMSLAEKAQLGYALAMQQTKGALGQAEKQSHNYRAGMMKIKGTMDDIKEQVFIDMQPTIQTLVGYLGKLADWFSKLNPRWIDLAVKIGMLLVVIAPVMMWIGIGITGFAKLFGLIADGIQFFGKLVGGISKLLSWLSKLGGLITKLIGYFQTFCTFIVETVVPLIEAGLTAIGTAFEVLAGIIGVSVGWLIVIILGIAIAVFVIVKYHKQIWAVMVSVWHAIWKFLVGVWNGFTTALSTIWGDFVKGVQKLWHNVADPLWAVIKSAIQIVGTAWANVWNGAKNVFQGFVNSIKSIWSGIKSVFKMPTITMSGSFDPVEMVRGNMPHLGIKWNASGGIFSKASIIGVGEDGSEAVIPLSNKAKVAPFAQAVASLMPNVDRGSNNQPSGDVVIQVASLIVREEADINKIAEKLFKLQEKIEEQEE